MQMATTLRRSTYTFLTHLFGPPLANDHWTVPESRPLELCPGAVGRRITAIKMSTKRRSGPSRSSSARCNLTRRFWPSRILTRADMIVHRAEIDWRIHGGGNAARRGGPAASRGADTEWRRPRRVISLQGVRKPGYPMPAQPPHRIVGARGRNSSRRPYGSWTSREKCFPGCKGPTSRRRDADGLFRSAWRRRALRHRPNPSAAHWRATTLFADAAR